STGSGAMCSPACGVGFTCCDGVCVNENNDILNCGVCGKKCEGTHPYCDLGKCGMPPCEGVPCAATLFCCGASCCQAGELCCTVPSSLATGAKCTKPTDMGSCPAGC